MKTYMTSFDAAGGKSYRLEIEVPEGPNIVQTFVAGGSPFVTKMEGGDILYEPIKAETATAEMICAAIPADLFAAQPLSRRATLYDHYNEVRWAGYVEPCLYSQGWGKIETLEINMVNTLAALKNVPYSSIEGARSSRSISDIIRSILSIDSRLVALYISDSVQFSQSETTPLAMYTFVNGENFFNERKGEDETDADLAWSCYDVLSEICRWLGLTMIQKDFEVWMVDYDDIRAGGNYYYRFPLDDLSRVPTRQRYEYKGHIDGSRYYDSDANFSLHEVYAKVKVTDAFFDYDSVIGDPFEGARNITQPETVKDSLWEKFFTIDDPQQLGSGGNTNLNFLKSVFEGYPYVLFYKFYYPREHWKLRCYFKNAEWGSPNNGLNLSVFHDDLYKGAFLLRSQVAWGGKNYKDDDIRRDIDKATNPDGSIDYEKLIDVFTQSIGLNSISLEDYIMLVNPPGTYHTYPDYNDLTHRANLRYPMFTLKPDSTFTFGGRNNYMVIKGSFIMSTNGTCKFPLPSDLVQEWDHDGSEDALVRSSLDMTFLWCSLRVGKKWWSGAEWVEVGEGGIVPFPIRYMDVFRMDTDERRGKNVIGREFKFLNTVNWRNGISEEGYCIPVPDVVEGDMEFTVYCPLDCVFESTRGGGDIGYKWPAYYVFLKNFDVKFVVGDPTLTGAVDQDTQYFNIIDEHNAGELGDIEFRVCTNDGKKPNHSSVLCHIPGRQGFVDRLYNKALSPLQIADGTTGWNGAPASEGLRQEEHTVYKISRQYSTPTAELTCNIKAGYVTPLGLYTDETLPGSFVVDTISTDYRFGYNTVKLVEKK